MRALTPVYALSSVKSMWNLNERGSQLKNKNALAILRMVFAFVIFYAVGMQLKIHVAHEFSRVNFFSYFTNLSNLATAIIFAVGGIRILRKRASTLRFNLLRGGLVVQMSLVGLIFNTLLRDVDLGSLLPWINVLLHMIAPAVVIADWLLDPPTSDIPQNAPWF